MMFIPKVSLIMAIADEPGSSPAGELKHDGVTYTFPNPPLFTGYKDVVAAVIDVVIQADKMLLTKKVRFPQLELHGVKIDNDEFIEERIPLYAYDSLTLGKTMRIISADVEGSKIPSKREPASIIPIAVDTLELPSGGTDRGTLIFLLPKEWFLIQKIAAGDSLTRIKGKNLNIQMNEFTKQGIVEYFRKYRVFT